MTHTHLYLLSSPLVSFLSSPVRRTQLEAQLRLFEFFYDCEELEAWLYEHWLRLQTAGLGRDLNHIHLAQHKHKVLFKISVRAPCKNQIYS